jgi:hypothetical protein
MFWDILGRRRQAFQFKVVMEQRPQRVPSTFDHSQVVEEAAAILQESTTPDDCQLAGFLDSDNGVQWIDFVMRYHEG